MVYAPALDAYRLPWMYTGLNVVRPSSVNNAGAEKVTGNDFETGQF